MPPVPKVQVSLNSWICLEKSTVFLVFMAFCFLATALSASRPMLEIVCLYFCCVAAYLYEMALYGQMILHV